MKYAGLTLLWAQRMSSDTDREKGAFPAPLLLLLLCWPVAAPRLQQWLWGAAARAAATAAAVAARGWGRQSPPTHLNHTGAAHYYSIRAKSE